MPPTTPTAPSDRRRTLTRRVEALRGEIADLQAYPHPSPGRQAQMLDTRRHRLELLEAELRRTP